MNEQIFNQEPGAQKQRKKNVIFKQLEDRNKQDEANITFLDVPFLEKKAAKNLDCKWSPIKKRWYINKNSDSYNEVINKWPVVN